MQNPKWAAIVQLNKLIISYNDNVIYTGFIQKSELIDLDQIKNIIEKQEFKTITRSKNIIKIKIFFLNVQLKNQDYLQIQRLNGIIQELKNQSQSNKAKIKELENNYINIEQKLQKIQRQHLWIEEDINSTTPFQKEYKYRVQFRDGLFIDENYHNGQEISFHISNGTCAQIHQVSYKNKKITDDGRIVSKIYKVKRQ